MFETLDPATVTEWRAGLTQALETDSGLDDAARVDTIRALEELVCTATAAQAALAAELDASQRAEQSRLGVPAARRGRGVAAQVALARRESHHRGRLHLSLATVVRRELPHTWRAWRAGRITEWTATVIARETACLDLEDRWAVDETIASDHDRLERMGVREVVAACQAEATRLDVASVVARRRRAEADRHVTLRPAPDTMTWLTALLPVKDGVAVLAALTRAGDTARASGDPRGRGQVMADTLVGAVLGDDGTASPARVALDVVMTDQSLFGGSDEPAHLDGFGPIPAELARELVVGACDRDETIWLRRLFAAPTTGELAAMDARARLFPARLARFIRLRDRVCRTPWCDAPIRHTDHATDHDADGETSAVNGQGLCEACNHAKQAPRWRAGPSPNTGSHTVETTTPTGHRYRSRAPTVATVREVPIRVDYVLTG
ncbi:HNH endonuclease [Nocardioides sp. GXQ0305]|uniref:HNH endonuclease n=1 Tax=Nocardioides sp. GXQ0305 TaxID=3423912 RepID=UPI003D7EA569